MLTILQKEHKVLREIAKPINPKDITSAEIVKAIQDMKDAMHAENDAVAIAAPQVGIPLRIFVMAGKARAIVKHEESGKDPEEQLDKTTFPPDEVYINPVIVKMSREKQEMEEGCLSVRYLYGKVERGVKATIEAYDENGNKFTKGGSGLIAQIFQHETDHLNGILFTDKASEVTELSEEERAKWREQNRKVK